MQLAIAAVQPQLLFLQLFFTCAILAVILELIRSVLYSKAVRHRLPKFHFSLSSLALVFAGFSMGIWPVVREHALGAAIVACLIIGANFAMPIASWRALAYGAVAGGVVGIVWVFVVSTIEGIPA